MGTQMSKKYVRLTKSVVDKGILVEPENVNQLITDKNIDHYISTYYYNEDHFKTFQQTGSVAHIVDVKTDKLWFDFDCKDNLDKARKDAIELVERLKKYNIEPKNLEIYFSGSKGFNVVANLKREINPTQVKHLATQVFGKGLETLDVALYNPSRILRVSGTKHQETGLFKTPISYKQLTDLTIDYIKNVAVKSSSKVLKKEPIDLDENMFEIKEVKEEIKNKSTIEFDPLTKPRGWKASKWALMQGFFGPGERDTSMMILAATCKAMGYDKLLSYDICKSALQKSWERYGKGDFAKEDLWKKIENVFNENWKGGQYSEKEDVFLQKKVEQLGLKELTNSSTVDIRGALKLFKGYAKNIDELTLKTGIEELDKRQRITVGMSWGIVAAPGSGKTSLALQMMHSMSNNGELCVFFSYDMFAPHVVQKIIQKHWNENDDIEVVFEKYKQNDEVYVKKVEELIAKEYPNVEFCFESGQNIDDIKQTIHDAEQKRGKKCRFVVVDYNELVISDVSDPTQSSNYTAQKMRALASNEQICVLSLFQPNKQSGDPSAEITSYLNAKGGGGIGQSVSFMLGVSRPGYNPRNHQGDKFISLNVVKNRMGPIFYVDLHWNGYRGEVRTLKPTEQTELNNLRAKAEEENNDDWG